MNTLLHEVSRRAGVRHHFVVPYAPWANGTVERVNRDILTLMRVLLSELRLPTQYWVDLVPSVMATLNSFPSAGRGGDRKSTRLNSKSLMRISYAVLCLKKKQHN